MIPRRERLKTPNFKTEPELNRISVYKISVTVRFGFPFSDSENPRIGEVDKFHIIVKNYW